MAADPIDVVSSCGSWSNGVWVWAITWRWQLFVWEEVIIGSSIYPYDLYLYKQCWIAGFGQCMILDCSRCPLHIIFYLSRVLVW